MVVVKICGICCPEDATSAVIAGADFLGLIFVESSARLLSTGEAKCITSAVRGDVSLVGVFQNQPLQLVNEIAAELQLAYVQLHGDESPQYCAAVEKPVIKAVSMSRAISREQVAEYAPVVDFFLLDRPKGKIDESWHERLQASVFVLQTIEHSLRIPFFLAGSLDCGNVAQRVRLMNPHGVDVASGVEQTARRKDHCKVSSFVESAKGARWRSSVYA